MTNVPPSRPITDDERDRVRELHAAGRNRNQIARELGRSGSTISKIAAELGLSFDRTTVKAATEARTADAADRRSKLALALLDDVEKLRAQLFMQHLYWDWGGRDHTYAEKLADEPTPADKAKLMQAIGIAVDRSLRLDHHDREDQGGLAAVDGWLRSMLGD